MHNLATITHAIRISRYQCDSLDCHSFLLRVRSDLSQFGLYRYIVNKTATHLNISRHVMAMRSPGHAGIYEEDIVQHY